MKIGQNTENYAEFKIISGFENVLISEVFLESCFELYLQVQNRMNILRSLHIECYHRY